MRIKTGALNAVGIIGERPGYAVSMWQSGVGDYVAMDRRDVQDVLLAGRDRQVVVQVSEYKRVIWVEAD